MGPVQPSKSHDDSRHRRYPGSQSLTEKYKKGVNPPLRRSTRFQLQSIQFRRKPVYTLKSSLLFRAFHENIVAQIYRRSKHKHFPYLLQELESQRQQLIESGTDKIIDDSDEEWQSLCFTLITLLSCDSESEASEDTLEYPSDTEIFGLRAKSPLSTPSPSFSEHSSESSDSVSPTSPGTITEESPSLSPLSPFLSASYASPSTFSYGFSTDG